MQSHLLEAVALPALVKVYVVVPPPSFPLFHCSCLFNLAVIWFESGFTVLGFIWLSFGQVGMDWH